MAVLQSQHPTSAACHGVTGTLASKGPGGGAPIYRAVGIEPGQPHKSVWRPPSAMATHLFGNHGFSSFDMVSV
jgi:hypothetical protein